MRRIFEQLFKSISELHSLLEDGVCSDSCGNLSESKARLELAKQEYEQWIKWVEGDPSRTPYPPPIEPDTAALKANQEGRR